MALVSIAIVTLILASFVRAKKKKVSPERTTKQQQTDELITVILPTINKGS